MNFLSTVFKSHVGLNHLPTGLNLCFIYILEYPIIPLEKAFSMASVNIHDSADVLVYITATWAAHWHRSRI